MGTLQMQDAGLSMGVNVRVTKRDKKTGAVLETREGHNKCLRTQLFGIVKYLNGEYNETQIYQHDYWDWIPRYLGVGTNNPAYDTTGAVGTEVNIEDTRLLSEISPRVKLPERNTIVNKTTNNYVQLVISAYLPSEYYNDETIAEAGLFSNETGNNCMFRIVFDGITKTEDSVIEVDWTISVISLDSSNSAYVEIDKVDLRNSIEQILDYIGENYDNLTQATTDIKDALVILVNNSATQTQVDTMTETLQNDYSQLLN